MIWYIRVTLSSWSCLVSFSPLLPEILAPKTFSTHRSKFWKLPGMVSCSVSSSVGWVILHPTAGNSAWFWEGATPNAQVACSKYAAFSVPLLNESMKEGGNCPVNWSLAGLVHSSTKSMGDFTLASKGREQGIRGVREQYNSVECKGRDRVTPAKNQILDDRCQIRNGLVTGKGHLKVI